MASNLKPLSPFTVSSASVEEGLRQAQQLEKCIDEDLQDYELVELADQAVALANLSASNLSPEQLADLERVVEDITEEVNEEEEPASLVEAKQESLPANQIEKKKKKHSKGFFKKVARKVAHTVRDTGRLARKAGKHFIGHHSSHGSSGCLDKKVHVLPSQKSNNASSLAHKVGKFFKKHKKAIIIGAIIAAAVATGIILVASGATAASSAAGAGAAGAGGLLSSDSRSKARPSVKASDSALTRVLDPNRIVRDAAFRQAELKAKQERYPSLVYPQEKVGQLRVKADAAFEQFKKDFVGIFDKKDAAEATGVVTSIASASKMTGGWAAATVIASALFSSDLVDRYKEKVGTLYAPAGEAYRELHQMEEANRQASMARCEKENYQPALQFHPTEPQAGIDTVRMVDKNNPNPNNQIIVAMPEE